MQVSSTLGVLLDANTLIPMPLCDTLLRAAEWRLYRPLWSQEILEETRRNLVKKGFTTKEGAARRIAAMQEYWPDALVKGYERLIPAMTNDPKDRHILAAAVKEKAQIIVTSNLKHFSKKHLAGYDVEAQTPDDFLETLYDMNPEAMTAILHQQAANLRRLPEGISPIQFVLASLYECGAKTFAEAMHQRILPPASS